MTDRELRLRTRIDQLRDRNEWLEERLGDAIRASVDARARAEEAEQRLRLRAEKIGGKKVTLRVYATEEERIEARRKSWRESKKRAWDSRAKKSQIAEKMGNHGKNDVGHVEVSSEA